MRVRDIEMERLMKHLLIVIICLASAMFFAGCEEKDRENLMNEKPQLYYVSEDGTQILCQDIEYEYDSREKNIEAVLNILKAGEYEKSKEPVLPEYVNIPEYSFSSGDVLTLKFDGTYKELTGVDEILARAAIVMSLDCIKDVNYVEFLVDNMPLTYEDGVVVGAMSSNNFVDSVTNTINSVYQQEVYLYYASDNGKHLLKKMVKCEGDINNSLESIILKALIAGTGTEDDDEIRRTINSECVVNSVITKENICYVDLSKEFLEKDSDISDEVYIYCVVNSLTELTFVNKVKFTIDGESVEMFNDKIEFAGLFERNLDLVRQEQ